MSKFRAYIELMRVPQWVKNLFVLAPAFFSGSLDNIDIFITNLIAFCIFCLTSSAVYCFNDIVDANNDRQHPEKRNRPIASGVIHKSTAHIIAINFAILSLVWSYILIGPAFAKVISIYIIINVLYTLNLKRIAIIDVCVIGLCFILRLQAGSVASGVALSRWIIIITFLLAIFIALGKRRDDLILSQIDGLQLRQSLAGYSFKALNISLCCLAVIIVVLYFIYTINPTLALYAEKLYLTGIFVTLGISRYLFLTIVRNKAGSPTKILYKDKMLQLCILGWMVTFAIILYQ